MDSESTPETSAIDDLVSEQLDEGQAPVAEAAPVSGDTQAAVAGDASVSEPVQAQAVGQVDPNTQASIQPTEQKYLVNGREYTAKEIQDAFTTAQQLPVVQNKYLSVLEQQRQYQAQMAQAPQQQVQSQPQMAPQQMLAQIRAKYDPVVQEAVKAGVVEADFAALFPGMAAQMLMYRDGFQQLAQQHQQTEQLIQAQTQQAQSQGLISDIGRSINALAQSGDAFASLKDPSQVQGFFSYLWDLNPQVGHLKNPDFLARQWVAYNKDQYLQNAQTQQVNAQRQSQVRLAQGAAATGTRASGSMSESPKSPLDLLTDDFFERSA